MTNGTEDQQRLFFEHRYSSMANDELLDLLRKGTLTALGEIETRIASVDRLRMPDNRGPVTISDYLHARLLKGEDLKISTRHLAKQVIKADHLK